MARVEDDLARLRAAWARYGQQVTGTDEAAALAAISGPGSPPATSTRSARAPRSTPCGSA